MEPNRGNVLNGIEMPRYRCHKEVWALRIKEIRADEEAEDSCGAAGATLTFFDAERNGQTASYPPLHVSPEYMRKHRPQVGGFYVVYDDGYKSFSPSRAFDEGYARIDDGTR